MTVKLKGCPFCGGKAKIVEHEDRSGGIYCSKCDFTPLINCHFGGLKSKEKAIEEWNTRAADENRRY